MSATYVNASIVNQNMFYLFFLKIYRALREGIHVD